MQKWWTQGKRGQETRKNQLVIPAAFMRMGGEEAVGDGDQRSERLADGLKRQQHSVAKMLEAGTHLCCSSPLYGHLFLCTFSKKLWGWNWKYVCLCSTSITQWKWEQWVYLFPIADWPMCLKGRKNKLSAFWKGTHSALYNNELVVPQDFLKGYEYTMHSFIPLTRVNFS